MKKTGGAGKRSPVFTKIFAYTLLLLVLMGLAVGGLFARQFISFYHLQQERQLAFSLRPVINAIEDKPLEEVVEIARAFAERNQSFKFLIQRNDGDVVFATPGTPAPELGEAPLPPPLLETRRQRPVPVEAAEGRQRGLPEDQGAAGQAEENNGRFILRLSAAPAAPAPQDAPGQDMPVQVATAVSRPPGGGEESYTLTGFISFSSRLAYGDLVGRCLLALALMLIIAFFGAVLFAKKVTRPLEEELERERVMEENQRLFFSAASHELKTPIAAARAMVEGMIAGVGDYKDHPKYLRECIRTLDSQSELVSEILELVKLDEKAETEALPLDLGELCGAVLAEYRPIAEQRGLTLEAELPPLKVSAGRQLLYRVLSNLTANAVQNTPAGESIRVRGEKRERGIIRLSILNTGAKIPGEVLSRLFEPFYRLDAARTRQGGRSGLGLAIVKKALDRMGIPFTLENAAGGVLFSMDLPPAGEEG